MNPNEVKKNINISVAKYCYCDNTLYKHIVCVVCDRFIDPGEEKCLSLQTLANNQRLFFPANEFDLSEELIACYRIHMPEVVDIAIIPENFEIEKCLLSPRSIYASSDHEDSGFLICEECNKCVKKNKRPKYCIANNYCFGSPPECLLRLTDIELAVLSPVKTHGYHFCYTGGQKHKLVGSILHFKIDSMSILRSIAYLSAAEANIVVIIYGNLTKEQYKTVSEKNKVRIPMLVQAIDWLLDNNYEWKKMNISGREHRELIQHLHQMTIPEYNYNFEVVENDDLELESEEVLDIFFPDKTLNIKNGGQESIEELQKLVQEATMSNDELFCKLSTMKESVQDYKDKNLVNACLLQFSFGRGSMDEERFTPKGDTLTDVVDVKEYLLYISSLSQKQFHEGLFVLIIYNMKRKLGMVSGAHWQVRNKIDATMIATKVTKEDVEQGINSTKIARGVYTEESNRGRQLLKAIDAVCYASPHSNEATKQAKSQAQTIQHYFGSPSIFLTVTPDDDNHFMIQILSGEFIDVGNIPVDQLDDAELTSRAKKRTQLRLKYPGLCALFFEYALNTVIFEVLGWNVKTNKQEHSGLFGKIDAFTCTIEEQGRSTLHAHFLIWVTIMNKLRNDLHHPHTQQRAESLICHTIDNVSSSKCFFNDDEFVRGQNNGILPRKRFLHECTQPSNYKLPVFPNDETLLELRSYKGNDDELIVCNIEDCVNKWSFNSASTSYLKDYIQVPLFSSYATEPRVKRLKALAVEYQKQQHPSSIPNFIIDFGYNFHFHTSSCVKETKNDRRKYVGRKLKNKCRFNYPQKYRDKTIIQNVTDDRVKWFHWNGSFELRHIKEVLVQREIYDAFQNTCCAPISYSRLTCNTNIRFVMPGPNAEYCFNYSMKKTNKEDSEPYAKITSSIGQVLSTIKYEDNNSLEAVRRLLSLAHKNQAENSIRPTLAAYLTRNDSRFIFSHQFAWCPLRDLKLLTNGEEVKVGIRFMFKTPYYRCTALNYLCRPDSLNHMCPLDFYSLYEVTTFSNIKAAHGAERLLNNVHFQHPSYDEKRHYCTQCVIKRDPPYLVQIWQSDFTDSANFQGDILSNNFAITDEVEKYSNHVLLLMMPYRCNNDLMIDEKYTYFLRHAIQQNKIDERHKLFLQYILDSKSNNLRFKVKADELERSAEHFHTPLQQTNNLNTVDDSILHYESNDIVNHTESFNIVDYLLADTDYNTIININSNNIIELNLKMLRNKSQNQCGHNCLPDATTTNENEVLYSNTTTFFETYHPTAENDFNNNNNNAIYNNKVNVIEFKKGDLMRLFRVNIFNCSLNLSEIIGADVEITLKEANGSAQSIVDWATKCGLDTTQKRAFEIITGYYILSYINTIPYFDEDDETDRAIMEEKTNLELLVGHSKIKSDQLICFLHGPAGSGKSTIIALLQSYSQKYHKLLKYESYNRAIILTAMTGVAATLIGGETAHSALHLKTNNRYIYHNIVESWTNTKLLIIDEISFSSNNDMNLIYKKLCILKNKCYLPFGGVNIIFCGDLRQLEPVGDIPLYKNHESTSSFFKIHVNCYIELNGNHRFATDPDWSNLLLRFRNGVPTNSDIDTINSKVVNPITDVMPSDMKYATYTNHDRDTINTAIFHQKIKYSHDTHQNTNNFIIIFCDNIKIKKINDYVLLPKPDKFYKCCSESNLKSERSGRMDPVLKIYIGCEVMLTENINVPNGLANGTRAIVDKIILTENSQYITVSIGDNIFARGIYASQVEKISLIHLNQNVQQRMFTIKCKPNTFIARIPIPKNILLNPMNKKQHVFTCRITQFPIVVNVATTGHKLQGTGVDKLFVQNWQYKRNWPYVVMSRVKTFNGLFLRLPLKKIEKTDYTLHPDYISFIDYFSHLSPTTVDYNLIPDNTNVNNNNNHLN